MNELLLHLDQLRLSESIDALNLRQHGTMRDHAPIPLFADLQQQVDLHLDVMHGHAGERYSAEAAYHTGRGSLRKLLTHSYCTRIQG